MDNRFRLGIFAFYDVDGIVDSYVLYLLEMLRPCFSRLMVISNSALDERNVKKLETYSDVVFVRENRGLDAAAYKAALTQFCNWDEICQYEEVVLFNNSFFGPIHSFVDMFAYMEKKDVDFWGISAGYSTDNPEKNILWICARTHPNFFCGISQAYVEISRVPAILGNV